MSRRNKGPIFTEQEKKGIFSLSFILFCRMLGLFLILPVFSALAIELEGATPLLVGFAMGGYGLTAAFLQIPFGIWSDRQGRFRVLIVAIAIFGLGSVIAALSENIYLLIVGRLIQGAGAMSAPIFALIADLTRPEVRSRANAGLGASVGMSFGVAMVISPFLGSWFGLQGIFWVVSALAALCMLVVVFFTPQSETQVLQTKEPIKGLILRVIKVPAVQTINVGAFVCSMGLSICFFILPMLLRSNEIPKSDWWMVYLPMLITGGIAMVPAAIIAEVKNRFREVMFVGALLALVAFVMLLLTFQNGGGFWWKLASLFIFFMAFNMFEPLFPSLVTRLTESDTKGTASGVYNFSQFMGQFVGAVLAGMFYNNNQVIMMTIMIVFVLFFLKRIYSFPNPEKRIPQESTAT